MIKVVRLRVGGNLGGNIITAEISIKLKGFFYLFIFFSDSSVYKKKLL